MYSASFGRTEYESIQCPQPQGVKEESKDAKHTLSKTWLYSLYFLQHVWHHMLRKQLCKFVMVGENVTLLQIPTRSVDHAIKTLECI